MNERKTTSMLQRIPVILAVTAASYGLQLPPQSVRPGSPAGVTSRVAPPTGGSTTTIGATRRESGPASA